MESICDRCGKGLDVDDAQAGEGEWGGATLCPDCYAATRDWEPEEAGTWTQAEIDAAEQRIPELRTLLGADDAKPEA